MVPDKKELFKEAIKLELNVSKLYGLFSDIFEDDRKFWLQLSIEEVNHATLLITASKEYSNINLELDELLYSNFEELRKTNVELEQLKTEYAINPPDKKTAYNTALNIEQSNQEKQFSIFMEKFPPKSKAMKLFQSLNGDNKNHIERIKNLIKKS